MSLPTWLEDMCNGITDPKDKQLIASRSEMFESLRLYQAHVKSVIAASFSILAVVTLILQLGSLTTSTASSTGSIGLGDAVLISADGVSNDMRVVLGIGLVVVPIISLLSIIVIYQYYRVYLAALLFASILHWKSQFKHSHPWFKETLEIAEKWNGVVSSSGDFIRKRGFHLRFSFVPYAMIIALLGFICGFYGIVLIVSGVS